MCRSQRSKNCRRATLDGSTYVPPLVSVTRRARSITASFLVPVKLCHLRLRLPVAGSLCSRMIDHLSEPLGRLMTLPLIILLPVGTCDRFVLVEMQSLRCVCSTLSSFPA